MVGETPAPGIEKNGDSGRLSPRFPKSLVSETQIRNQPPVPLQIRPLQVGQEAAAASDHLQEAAAAVVVLLVVVEVAPKIVDSSRKEGNLDRSAATVLFVELILLDNFFAVDGHLVRASAGVYAAGEAPPRMFLKKPLACKSIKKDYPPQPRCYLFLSYARAALAASTSNLSCSTRAEAEAKGLTSRRWRTNSTLTSSP